MADWRSLLGRFAKPPQPERLVLPAPPTVAQLQAALTEVDALALAKDLPPVVVTRVTRVTTLVRETIPRLDQLTQGSSQTYSVMATATDYLPEALEGYLRLPRDWANSRPVDAGRTSLMVLIDQLDLLAHTMGQIFDAACRADAAALVAHGQFLAEKFAAPSRLSVPAAPISSPPASGQALQPPEGVE